MNLRGLCAETMFDQVFIPRFGADNLIMYYGNFDSIIAYDVKRGMWVMNVTYTTSVRAESNSSYGSLALGNLQYNDTECTQDGETITLSTCTTNQFTCDDGFCIGIDSRCNGDTDCDDQSDEVGCQSISVGKSYKKDDSPPPYAMFDEKELVQVNFSTIFIHIQGKTI